MSQHLALFGAHGFSSVEYMCLMCHVTSHNHLIEGACRFMGGSSL